MERNTVNANFLQFINELKLNKIVLTDKAFCESISILPQVLGDIKGNRRSVTIEIIQNTCIKYSVSSDIFFNTDNNYIINSVHENMQENMSGEIKNQNQLTQKKENNSMHTFMHTSMHTLSENRNELTQKKYAKEDIKGIPLIPIEAMAGFGVGDVDIREPLELYNVPDFKGVDFLIRVKGSSMYPKYSSGDVVACKYINSSQFLQWGKCYVLDTTQGALVKRIFQSTQDESIECRSDNKDYPPFVVPKIEIRAIALIIGVIRLE
jgi:repressor LexA